MTSVVKYSSATTLLFAALLLYACNRGVAPVAIKIQGETQGTYYSITYYDTLHRDFTQQIDSILEAVDNSVSVYKPNSVISRLNRNEEILPDEIFTANLNIAYQVSKASNGAFDCTIGNLIEAWGWGFSKRDSITPELIDSLKAISGYERVSIGADGRLVKDDPSITINFNAIAQGYTSDLIAQFLTAKGVTDFLVDVGGELVASGQKPDGTLWNIGIELPSEESADIISLDSRPVKALLTITGKGIATSGNYRKFYVEDGLKFSHTIDPKTGYPVTHSMLSATVVAENATLADAWATAFMVLGMEESKKFLKKHPELEAYFIYSDEKGIDHTWISPGLKESIIEQL